MGDGRRLANGVCLLLWLFLTVVIPVFSALDREHKLQLVGGDNPFEGQLQLSVNGSWNTLCDDAWYMQNADVACRQLGFPTGAMNAVYWAIPHAPNETSLSFLQYKFHCQGNESSLLSCSYTLMLDEANCNHGNNIVGVRCNFPGYVGCYDSNLFEEDEYIIRCHYSICLAPDTDIFTREHCTNYLSNDSDCWVNIQECIKLCRHYQYAGLTRGNECICRIDDYVNDLTLLPNMECQSSCMGDKDHVCGGDNQAVSVYSTWMGKCGGHYKSDEGYIVSPGFPGGYDDNVKCEWTVTVSRGNAVKLTFLKINLIPYKNVLEILDSIVITPTTITVLYFNEWFSLSEEIAVTLQNRLYVNEWAGSSNEYDTSNGFVIQFKAVSKCNASDVGEVLPQHDVYYEGDVVNITQLCGDSVVTDQFICAEDGEWMPVDSIQDKCQEVVSTSTHEDRTELITVSDITSRPANSTSKLLISDTTTGSNMSHGVMVAIIAIGIPVMITIILVTIGVLCIHRNRSGTKQYTSRKAYSWIFRRTNCDVTVKYTNEDPQPPVDQVQYAEIPEIITEEVNHNRTYDEVGPPPYGEDEEYRQSRDEWNTPQINQNFTEVSISKQQEPKYFVLETSSFGSIDCTIQTQEGVLDKSDTPGNHESPREPPYYVLEKNSPTDCEQHDSAGDIETTGNPKYYVLEGPSLEGETSTDDNLDNLQEVHPQATDFANATDIPTSEYAQPNRPLRHDYEEIPDLNCEGFVDNVVYESADIC